MLNNFAELNILVSAALVDGQNFRGYAQEHTRTIVAQEVKAVTGEDLTTKSGHDMLLKLLASDPKLLRYRTVGMGKKLYAAMIRQLIADIGKDLA